MPLNFLNRITLLWVYYTKYDSLPSKENFEMSIWTWTQKNLEIFYRLLIAGNFIYKSSENKWLPTQKMIELLNSK